MQAPKKDEVSRRPLQLSLETQVTHWGATGHILSVDALVGHLKFLRFDQGRAKTWRKGRKREVCLPQGRFALSPICEQVSQQFISVWGMVQT